MTDLVLYRLDQRIATLTLNRPDSLNSLSLATVEALLAGLDRALADSAAALVLPAAVAAFPPEPIWPATRCRRASRTSTSGPACARTTT